MNRRTWLLGASFAGLGAALYWMFVGSDEAKVLAVVRKLIEGAGRPEGESPAAYQARSRQLLLDTTLAECALRAPELNDSLNGAEEISTWASDVIADFDSARFSLDQSEVKTNADFAHVLAVITLFVKRAGFELRDTRRVDIRLRKRSEWRIDSIDVAERSVDQPEARP
jgi:hypothetical protein